MLPRRLKIMVKLTPAQHTVRPINDTVSVKVNTWETSIMVVVLLWDLLIPTDEWLNKNAFSLLYMLLFNMALKRVVLLK